MSRDWILTTPMATPELCRLFHGIDCRICKALVVLPVRNPTQAPEPVQLRRCEGDHAFENWCNACGAAQPSGECEVCPHMPWEPPSAHYVRRPCRACGSADLQSVRVRPPRSP